MLDLNDCIDVELFFLDEGRKFFDPLLPFGMGCSGGI